MAWSPGVVGTVTVFFTVTGRLMVVLVGAATRRSIIEPVTTPSTASPGMATSAGTVKVIVDVPVRAGSGVANSVVVIVAVPMLRVPR